LLGQRINDRLPVGLPPGVPIAHKTGNLPGLAHDAGIVYAPEGPYIVVVLTEDLWDVERGYAVIHDLARQVHTYFAHRPALVALAP
jgi:beta-lactamase class A